LRKRGRTTARTGGAQRYGAGRALLAEDIEAALARLKAAVEVDEQLPQPDESAQGEDEEPAVSLAHRALPLIELLQAAAKAKCNLMWDSSN
jgi:hypothetical protein